MSNTPVILITGTRKGIGRYLVDHYIEAGYRVVGCSREPANIESDAYIHCITDVRDEAGVKAMLSTVRRDLGRLDILINNAGIASMNHSLLTTTDMAQRIFETNVIGTFVVCREAAKLMQRRRYGRIVNLVSVATPLKLEGEALYASSKAAVTSLTQIMARELSAYNITVNAVGPAPIHTDLIQSVPQEKLQQILDRQAIHRFGEFSDVANAVDFFIKPESEFITGQVIYLGGV